MVVSRPAGSASAAGAQEELLQPDMRQVGRPRLARRWLLPLGLGVVVLALGLLVDSVALPAPGGNASLDQIRGPLQEGLALLSGYAPAAAGAMAGVAVLTLLVDLVVLRRLLRRHQIRNAAAGVFKVRPETVRVRDRWMLGRLRRATVRYTPGAVIADVSEPLEAALGPLAGMPVTVRHVPRRNRFVVRPWAPEPAAAPETERVEKINATAESVHTQLQSMLPDWHIDQRRSTVDGGGQLEQLVAGYGTTTKDISPTFRSRIATILDGKVPSPTGAWSLTWYPEDNEVLICPARPLPERVLNRGLECVDAETLNVGDVPFGTRTNGATALLRLRKLPHLVVVGVTGAGKSAFLRTLVTCAAALGWRIVIADPKVLTFLRGFADWPGVEAIATSGEDMEQLMLEIKGEMNQRYQVLAAGLVREEQLVPTLMVVDETTEYLIEINDAAAERAIARGKKAAKSPAERATWSVARKGRQAMTIEALGTQRPDVSFIPGEARDNLTNRIAVGYLKPHAAEMMFGTRHVTQRVFKTDLDPETRAPRQVLIPGRATVEIGHGVETVQVWWTPDPDEASAPDELEALSVLREQAETALARRAAQPDHLAQALQRLEAGETGPLGRVAGTLDHPVGDADEDDRPNTPATATVADDGPEELDEPAPDWVRGRDLEAGQHVQLTLDQETVWVRLTGVDDDPDDTELVVLDYVDEHDQAGTYSLAEDEPVPVRDDDA